MKKQSKSKKRSQQSSSNKLSISAKTKRDVYVEMFTNDMRKNGFIPPKYIYTNGKPQRFYSGTDLDNNDCWYNLRLKPLVIGFYGHCNSDIQFMWAVNYEDSHEKECIDETSNSKVIDSTCAQYTLKIKKDEHTLDELRFLIERTELVWTEEIPTVNVSVGSFDEPVKDELNGKDLLEIAEQILSDILSATQDTNVEWFNIDENLIEALCAFDESYSIFNNGKPSSISCLKFVLESFKIKREIVNADDGVVEGYMKKHLLEALAA